MAELAAIRTSIDAAIARLAMNAAAGKLDEGQIGAISLVVNYVDRVLAERRETLLTEEPQSAPIARLEQGKPKLV
jgi:hypothetical protein